MMKQVNSYQQPLNTNEPLQPLVAPSVSSKQLLKDGSKPIPPYAVHDETSIRGFFGPYRFLSNFYPATIVFRGLTFPSTENAFQALKFPKERWPAFTTMTPSEAKKEGKLTTISLVQWQIDSLEYMRELNIAKFSQNPELLSMLKATAPKYLEELNSWGDRFWGVSEGEGKNNLGIILMEIRDTLLR